MYSNVKRNFIVCTDFDNIHIVNRMYSKILTAKINFDYVKDKLFECISLIDFEQCNRN